MADGRHLKNRGFAIMRYIKSKSTIDIGIDNICGRSNGQTLDYAGVYMYVEQ